MRTSHDDQLATRLSSIYLFSALDRKNLRRLLDLGRVAEHPAGQKIVTQGELPYAFHLLLDGEADVVIDGNVRQTLRPGDYFGEIAVIDQKPRTASVVAKTDVRAWFVNAGMFNEILEREPSFTHSILVGMCSLVRVLQVPAQRSEQVLPTPRTEVGAD